MTKKSGSASKKTQLGRKTNKLALVGERGLIAEV